MYRNITIFFSLFFQCFGPHRHLHSFPTRRSSDLPGAWEHDPAAADLMIFTVEKYAPLARKHGLDPWEAASAAFDVMRTKAAQIGRASCREGGERARGRGPVEQAESRGGRTARDAAALMRHRGQALFVSKQETAYEMAT